SLGWWPVKKMAIRATPTSRPSSPYTTFLTPKASFVPRLIITPKVVQLRTITTSLLTSTTTLLLTTHKYANALTLPKEDIITSLTKVETTIEQIQELGTGVLDFSQNNLQIVINLALPILRKSGDQALKIASPVIEEVSKKTHQVIESSGIDPEPIYKVSKVVGDVAQIVFEGLAGSKPVAVSALETILKAEPILIMETSAGLLVTYVLLPLIWSAISFNFRGYKGKLSPAHTLDLLSRRNYFMIDIRLEDDKNTAGIPLLPSSVRYKMITVPAEELPSKVEGLVRNTETLEAALAALKISYLKMINRHSNIVIIDSYCDMAKLVAKELTSLGFKNCWIVAGGFSGNQGWLETLYISYDIQQLLHSGFSSLKMMGLERLVMNLKTKVLKALKPKKLYDKVEKSESMRVEIRSKKARKLIEETLKIADSPKNKSYAF
ncbi:calcium sensing receptor protein, partial [Thalictrum thalictroides]